MFFRKYVIPALALAGVAVAVYTVRSENRPTPAAAPVAEPAKSPFDLPVAGAGIVESSTQNLAIGTSIAGVVMKVHVNHGQHVRRGDPLFTIDDRAVRAELAVREAAVNVTQASLARLEALPRAEDVPPVQARVEEMQAMLVDMRSQLTAMESVTDRRAIVEEELTRRRNAVLMAEARFAEARASLEQLKAGAWSPDLQIARMQVASAQAAVDAVRIDLERLTVRSPIDGQVLQLNVRVGEFAQAGPLSTPLILLGGVETLHVRVDVDENDAWRVRPEATAVASLRGNSSMKTDLTFVRIEPYVVPKRSLTGESVERVDTRVLQVIYSFTKPSFRVYVGQQMDVYINAGQPEPPRS
ncbi:MAG: HlyD family secretion protein [Phycisphaerales bacterium]